MRDQTQKSLMAELARDVELLIDFGGERWHERFKEDAKCEECV